MKSSLDSGPVVPLRKTLAIAALAATFCQCASGPVLVRRVHLEPGSRALVTYQQPGLNLTVINQSSMTPAEAVAARKADPSLKLLPDDQVQVLLDMLGAKQFFDMASAVADPEAKSWLTVLANGEKYIVSGRSSRGDYAFHQRFQECLFLFNTVYNSKDSFTGSKLTTDRRNRRDRATNSESPTIRRKNRNGNQP